MYTVLDGVLMYTGHGWCINAYMQRLDGVLMHTAPEQYVNVLQRMDGVSICIYKQRLDGYQHNVVFYTIDFCQPRMF